MIVYEMVPAFVQALLEKQLSHEGMQLRDLAVFAATLSDLVYNEGIKNLHAVYEILEVPASVAVSLASFHSALRGYLAATIVGEFGPKLVDARGLKALETKAREVYPEYDDLLVWLEDTRLARDFMGSSGQNPFREAEGISPEQADALMHDLYHKFGSLNNLECMAQKDRLVDAEYPGTGRVSLAKFYADQENQLQESVAYIRNMGALDETNPAKPAVVIPNYMSSPSRCMPFSSYFSVCCPDDCESVIGRIEEAVQEPSADPNRLARIVADTPSDTQEAPRNLTATLVTRLGDIAGRHGGRVPLHGRLFMQWLHHAYPRECPYPHVSGTVKPVTQDEWLDMHEDIDNAMVSDDERAVYSQAHTASKASLETLPWSSVEELVSPLTKGKRSSSWFTSVLRPAMLVLLLSSFAISLVRSTLVASSEQKDKQLWV